MVSHSCLEPYPLQLCLPQNIGDLVVRDRVPRRTGMPSVIEPGTTGNHAPIGRAQNDGSSDIQEIPVSMDNVHPEGTEDQYVTYPSGEDLGRNVHVRRSKRIRNSPHR